VRLLVVADWVGGAYLIGATLFRSALREVWGPITVAVLTVPFTMRLVIRMSAEYTYFPHGQSVQLSLARVSESLRGGVGRPGLTEWRPTEWPGELCLLRRKKCLDLQVVSGA